MVIAAASLLFNGSNHQVDLDMDFGFRNSCKSLYALKDGLYCSMPHEVTSCWMRSSIDNRRASDLSSTGSRNPCFGSTQFDWSSVGRDLGHFRVSVAADYSDSIPDSSNYTSHQGYHPLEEVKTNKTTRDTHLTFAEIARTTVEANSNALLVFPGTVHCEPHLQMSWAEFQYVIDDYGDIFFEICDDKNVLQAREASNPVNVLIGMDIPMYENKRLASEYNVFKFGSGDDIPFDDDYFEVTDPEMSDAPIDWGLPDTCSWVHPFYFAKCLTKASEMEYGKKMDYPSNGVSIVGCLRPAFADEESYLRRLFSGKDSDDYDSDWRDGDILSFSPKSDGSSTGSTIYRLDIMGIELFSVYGNQTMISVQDFQDAEPDVLAHSTSILLELFHTKGIRFDTALKALCKKKGLHVEGAHLIGLDSLGMDVRIFCGVEVRTHRFPFKVRVWVLMPRHLDQMSPILPAPGLLTTYPPILATCEAAAEKQIQQLLFPRSHRKKFRSHGDGFRDTKSF